GFRLDHARFLALKIGALFSAFHLPTGATPIRVTPSYTEDRSLEDRSIPYYYDPKRSPAIHEAWSHSLNRAEMSAYNYSYNATEWTAQGGAAAPLTSALG